MPAEYLVKHLLVRHLPRSRGLFLIQTRIRERSSETKAVDSALTAMLPHTEGYQCSFRKTIIEFADSFHVPRCVRGGHYFDYVRTVTLAFEGYFFQGLKARSALKIVIGSNHFHIGSVGYPADSLADGSGGFKFKIHVGRS